MMKSGARVVGGGWLCFPSTLYVELGGGGSWHRTLGLLEPLSLGISLSLKASSTFTNVQIEG